MSGGHYNYFYLKFNEFVENLEIKDNPKRQEFKDLLLLVSEACYKIEWEDSGDNGENDADEAIEIALKGKY
jgi:hypothetical protein